MGRRRRGWEVQREDLKRVDYMLHINECTSPHANTVTQLCMGSCTMISNCLTKVTSHSKGGWGGGGAKGVDC